MMYRTNLKNRSASPVVALVMAAAAFQMAPAMAGTGLGAEPIDRANLSAGLPAATLDKAAGLVGEGQLIAARSLVSSLLKGQGLSVRDSERAYSMLQSIAQRIESADPMEMSLQKAELAIEEGNLSEADRHAGAVSRNPGATPEQAARASQLSSLAAERRSEFAPLTAGMLDQAERDFAAGRYAEAKAGLNSIRRSGVALTPEQELRVDGYQSRIIAMETAQGEAFVAPLAMSVVPAAQDQPEGQPEAPPAEGQPSDLITQALTYEAQGLFAEAERAFEEGRMNEAQGKYSRLQEARYSQYLQPEQNALVKTRLTEIRLRAGAVGGGGIVDVDEMMKLRHDQTLAMYENHMSAARQALNEGDTNAALLSVANATLEINRGRQALSDAEYQESKDAADSLKQDIERRQLEMMRVDQDRTARQVAEQQEESTKIAREQKSRQINELLDKARAYQADQRYEDALSTVEQILFLDPINPSGMLLKPVIEDIIRFQRYAEIRNESQRGFQDLRLDNTEAMIPTTEALTFPADWPSKSILRGGPEAFMDSEANRGVLRQLASTKIPKVEVTDNNLEDVLEYIGTITQLDMDVQWEQMEAVGVQRESTVSLNLKNVAADVLLDRVIEKVSSEDQNAAWGVVDGILTVTSDEALRRKTTLHIYDIRDLLIEVPDYDEVPTIDLQSVLQSGQGGGGQSPFQDDNEDDEDEDRRTLDERTDDILNIITKIVDSPNWEDNGGDTGQIMKLNGNLIIINTPANHRQISSLLGQLRQVRSMQINVETKFLLVNQDWFEQIGFDLDVYLNAENNQVRAAQANTPNANVRDFFQGGGSGTIDATISSPAGGSTTGGAHPNVVQGRGNPPGAGWSPIGFVQDSLGLSSSLAPSTDWSNAILGGAPALGIAGSFLDDIQVDFLVRATQADRRSVQLTAPRLTFTNGQTSNIYVATQVAFVSDLQPVVGDSAVGFDPEVDVATEGVTLLVEGTISADRRYVTLNVDAGVSRIDGFAQQAVTAVAGGQLINSADTQSFIQLPTVTVTRVRTTATVPDQGTVLLGGQRIVTEYEVESGVPVLSKIPVINRFFTNRIESKEEQTLLILLKPTVLITSEQEDKNFPGLANSLELGLGG
jgi:type II secretory pathway component GspD/PulD (secretin)/tetratricopeptide (TPR) repeat protein